MKSVGDQDATPYLTLGAAAVNTFTGYAGTALPARASLHPAAVIVFDDIGVVVAISPETARGHIACIQSPSCGKHRARMDPEPGKDLVHVQLDRPLANAELLGDHFVRLPEGRKLGNFPLAARELHAHLGCLT